MTIDTEQIVEKSTRKGLLLIALAAFLFLGAVA